ncbi:hypothetical protein PPL_05953 [Heterostelium album PN500]|uniref:Carbohydrate binding domain-containing protein n=1 Tax=Heterostelium pallidum (strain ATCC 26659 / Pp 5 / PN500) TaxID=670386 RepID=D3BBT4_HETP5|nr:hypothetical protein PPL_05953 [Heterostelium album PN500]EFA81117.1 hypothetical protein PPL_05953 [Heterostelium album PN500]|eukprot:XP_020433235.1 hypothetical protein PPL_05953 [Heterostelium album PN500]
MNKIIIGIFVLFTIFNLAVSDNWTLTNTLSSQWTAPEGTWSVFNCQLTNNGAQVTLLRIDPNGQYPDSIWGAFYYDSTTDTYPVEGWAATFQEQQTVNFGYKVLSANPIDWDVIVQ